MRSWRFAILNRCVIFLEARGLRSGTLAFSFTKNLRSARIAQRQLLIANCKLLILPLYLLWTIDELYGKIYHIIRTGRIVVKFVSLAIVHLWGE